ncbi:MULTISPECIES: GntR family transcriptional regulator [unclassified Bosea (in: a-proteobacteria)]|uniref:GntR family transcriptional regulator n=1 Tax=unclassified Bosea (in: a-proteobacteria) TaxID=2653178 RepID=UPI000F763485|nr:MULTISPECIES: GntR family transcriptional regulator [unclassified Bosea (in: a-proteobacteria)]AZO80104.1 GntR family transcriptional regulator [Bosea sp. Tri-49]RXT22891.1 GntR family transcriptional regulator [Bosea sp. Tri-39]RXT38360.1 GntR family transcriptional regulator [Bosea sp. Tri-54]
MSQPDPDRDGEPLKLRERAYASFTERLLAREIRPGQFVTQRELVAMTGFPLGAIRELIPRLEAEGLIKTVPQRGMQVAHVDLNLIRNAFQFRLFLEKEATAAYTKNATDAEIAEQRQRHEAIIRRAEAGGDETLIEDAEDVDRLMHEMIIDHLDNDIVSQAFRVTWLKIRLIRQYETRIQNHILIPVMQDHLKIITAIEARDPDAAAAEMSAHINNARTRAMSY